MGACACLGGRGGWRRLLVPCKQLNAHTCAGPALDGGPRAARAQRHPGGRVRGAARTASEPDPLVPASALRPLLLARPPSSSAPTHPAPGPAQDGPGQDGAGHRHGLPPGRGRGPRAALPHRRARLGAAKLGGGARGVGARAARRAVQGGGARGGPPWGDPRSLLGCWAQLLRCALPAGLCVCTYKRGRRRMQARARAAPSTPQGSAAEREEVYFKQVRAAAGGPAGRGRSPLPPRAPPPQQSRRCRPPRPRHPPPCRPRQLTTLCNSRYQVLRGPPFHVLLTSYDFLMAKNDRPRLARGRKWCARASAFVCARPRLARGQACGCGLCVCARPCAVLALSPLRTA